MHSNKVSVIIGLVIIAIGVFLLIVYYEKQGEYTFGFIKSVYEEIRADKTSTSIHPKRGDILPCFLCIFMFRFWLLQG